jgi:photosystem II stability/assembly factor-like uncharacterized protein
MLTPMNKLRSSVLPLASVLIGAVLMGQGCLGSTPSGPKGPDGGVFKTTDRGVTWAQKRVLIQGPKGVSIADNAITSMAFDPEDHNTIYAGTDSIGLIVSLDGGDSWQQSGTLNKGRIESVAVDSKDKCTVYASQGNKIYKTTNCGRDWAQAWFDPKTDKTFTRLVVDWFNPTIIYAGTSEGDILKSTDAGSNWLVSQRASSGISGIAIDPRDSRIVYASTQGDGIWKTTDGGNTWTSIKKQLSEFDTGRRAVQVLPDPLDANLVYLVSKYGILLSKDQGITWTALSLTSPPNSVDIRSFAINPRNNKELSYITPNTLLVSSDAGATWTAKKLPSTRNANVILVDPEQGNTLYLGMGFAPKQ